MGGVYGREVSTGDAALLELIAKEAEAAGIVPADEVEPPASFKSFGDDIATAYCCPKCGYEWSGKPK